MEKNNTIITGKIGTLREIKSKDGNVMAFGTFRDSENSFNLTFFSNSWEKCKNHLKLNEIVNLTGSFDDSNPDRVCFLVSGIVDNQ